mgnify:CR=1 FL=1
MFIPRRPETWVLDHLGLFPVVGLFGPRQVGKTATALLDQIPYETIYVSGRYLARMASRGAAMNEDASLYRRIPSGWLLARSAGTRCAGHDSVRCKPPLSTHTNQSPTATSMPRPGTDTISPRWTVCSF